MLESILECIKSRRSIRRYTEKQITGEQLAVLLEAAVWAPSGSNSQSWLFVAIQDLEALRELNTVVKKTFLTWTPDDDYPAKKRAVLNAAKESFCFYHSAPTLIIAANAAGYQNGIVDCALALQNIFLAAQSMGLGSCWINQLRWLRNEAPVREFLTTLGLPREYDIFGAAAVGYPDHTPPAPVRKGGTTVIIPPGDSRT